jgi:hypothetical protein
MGFSEEGISALTGVPVFSYNTVPGDTSFFATILAADQNNYIMGASTGGSGPDTTNNFCNIANRHAYSILAAFNIKASNGALIPSLMIRNPWGKCSTNCYNGTLSSTDKFWTTAMKN